MSANGASQTRWSFRSSTVTRPPTIRNVVRKVSGRSTAGFDMRSSITVGRIREKSASAGCASVPASSRPNRKFPSGPRTRLSRAPITSMAVGAMVPWTRARRLSRITTSGSAAMVTPSRSRMRTSRV